MSSQNGAEPASCYDIPQLLQLFESLGDNCDFGVVQRAAGVEPFGLFRFAACKTTDLIALLRDRFAQLGEPQDLWLDEVGPRREYWVKSRGFAFESHTDRFGGKDDPEVARSAQIEKMRFLKSRLLRDLSRARKLFIFKGHSDIATIAEIAKLLQTFGSNGLLWVNLADAEHQAGSVERAADGLLLGFVSRFGTYDEAPSLPVEEWIAVCASAFRLWRGADPPKAICDNLIARATLANSCQWLADASATTRTLARRGPGDSVVLQHRLERTAPGSVYRAYLPIDCGGSFVFSVWVHIPPGFRGRQVAALLTGFSSAAMWTADLKFRPRWQRIWVTANLPEDARSISCDILVEGAVGSVFQSALWCLERGSRPVGYGFIL